MHTFFLGLLSAAVVLSFLSGASAATHDSGLAKRHFGRSRAPARNETNHLTKRFDSAKFSFYDAGLGACGKTNSNSENVVAINIPQWDGGSHCFETITITYKGKSVQAQIVDQCEICPYGGLDFSRGLFYQYATEDDGIIYGSWVFGAGGSEEPQPPKPKPSPSTSKTTPKPTPTPESSSVEVKPSSTKTSHSSTSSSTVASTTSTTKTRVSSSSATPTSSSSVIAVTSGTSEGATASASATATSGSSLDTLAQFNQALFQLAGVIGAGAGASSD